MDFRQKMKVLLKEKEEKINDIMIHNVTDQKDADKIAKAIEAKQIRSDKLMGSWSIGDNLVASWKVVNKVFSIKDKLNKKIKQNELNKIINKLSDHAKFEGSRNNSMRFKY